MTWQGDRTEFQPKELAVLDDAFADAWRLYAGRRGGAAGEAARQALARAVMDIARTGEDDPFFIARAALGRVIAAETIEVDPSAR